MATADSVKAKIQGLIASANAKTGNTDADLTTAVNTLIDGFGQGGVELPEIDPSVHGTASDLALGKQLIGADGNVVEGSLVTLMDTWFPVSAENVYERDGKINAYHDYSLERSIVDPWQTEIIAEIPLATFGTARSEDVAQGMTFTSESGLKVPGTMEKLGSSLHSYDAKYEIDGEYDFCISFPVDQKKYVEGEVFMYEHADIFGEAEPEDVAKGVTFTSRNGLKIEGTHECSGGVTLPEIDPSVLGTASDLVSGKQLIDADGNIVTGELLEKTSFYKTNANVDYESAIQNITLETNTDSDMVLRAGKRITLYANGSNFGDALASDVAKGKTFTSENGLKIEGTVQEYSDSYRTPSFTGTIEWDDDWVVRNTLDEDVLLRKGTVVNTWFGQDVFGDAYPEHVKKGYTFTSRSGVKIEGTMESTGGSVIKTGTTTSGTIATGLSEIEEFFIYKESQTATGLIHLHYSKTGGTSYMYASAWSTNSWGTKTITNGTTAATVNGGSITLPSSTATSGGLSSGITYKWTAVGTE